MENYPYSAEEKIGDEGTNEIREAAFNHPAVLFCGRIDEIFDTIAHSGKYLWIASAVFGIAASNHKIGKCQGNGKISCGDYAGYVYSRRRGAFNLLGSTAENADSGGGYHRCFHGGGDGSGRKGNGRYAAYRKEKTGKRGAEMKELLGDALFFGVVISLLTYELGMWMKRKWKLAIFNPLLISILAVIAVLLVFQVDYDTYNEGAKYLSYLLTPATICLAVPLYEQVELLKKNVAAILVGILAGALASVTCVLLMSMAFGLNHEEYVTLLPKSITTAIGMGVSEELGGIVTITVAVIVITGVLGNIIAEHVCRIFKIREPIAKGIAIGSASHAIGTAKAMEMGEVEGAMSGLSIAVAGVVTVVLSMVYVYFW